MEKLIINNYLILLIFLLLLFNPQVFPVRIIRDNIYHALSILTIFGFFRVALNYDNKFLFPILYGFIASIFYMNREEGVWVLPSIVLISIYAVYENLRSYDKLLLLVKKMGLFTLSCIFIPGLVASINYAKYGKFQIVDFKSSNFESALSAMYSVNSGPIKPFIPVSREKRELLYEVSPAFSELKEYFNGPGQGWFVHGCNLYPDLCQEHGQDYFAGWFMWALRDAVASRGYYKNANIADEFYGRLSDEINGACRAKKIYCLPQVIKFIPPANEKQFKNFPKSFMEGLEILNFKRGIELTLDSPGSLEDLEVVRTFLRTSLVKRSPSGVVHLSGWIDSSKGEWIVVKCRDSKPNESIRYARMPSTDLEGLKNSRFRFEVDAGRQCAIFIESDQSNPIFDIDSHVDKPGGYHLNSGLFINFDNLDSTKNPKIGIDYIDIKKYLLSIYSFFSIYINMIGFICFLFLSFFIFRKKMIRRTHLYILGASLVIAVLFRLSILSLIAITSFPAMSNLYLGPLFPLLILFSTISIALTINIAAEDYLLEIKKLISKIKKYKPKIKITLGDN